MAIFSNPNDCILLGILKRNVILLNLFCLTLTSDFEAFISGFFPPPVLKTIGFFCFPIASTSVPLNQKKQFLICQH